jgi:hypothetical protein
MQNWSQSVVQHSGSAAQTWLTQLGLSGGSSHCSVNGPPKEQMLCSQDPLAVGQSTRLQTVMTSSTQIESHDVSQQYESTLQTDPTQSLSQLAASGAPVVQ